MNMLTLPVHSDCNNLINLTHNGLQKLIIYSDLPGNWKKVVETLCALGSHHKVFGWIPSGVVFIKSFAQI